jgi:spermidine/putrescine transport system substrate-binding protein
MKMKSKGARFLFTTLAVMMILALVASCAPAEPVAPEAQAEPVEEYEGIPPDLIEAVRAEGSVLNVYNWSFYIDEGRVEEFEELYDIDVTYDLYESNEEMKAKIQAGGSGYDVVYPTQSTLFEMVQLGLLQPLNHDWIPNMQYLLPKFVDPSYDPGNEYSVAYMWGTTGYAHNTTETEGDPRVGSWALMFEGEDYAGQMTMLDDYTIVVGAALKYLGYSLNTEDPDELAEARDVLLSQKPWIRAYISGPVREQMIAGDVWIGQLWSGDVLYVNEENPDYAYVLPEEGGEVWVDSMAITADAAHPAAAHLWINYMHEPEVQAAIVDYVYYPSPNAAAQEFIAAEILENTAVYPSDEALANSEFITPYTGEALRIREQIWEELKQ